MTVADPWPPLPLREWRETYAALHMWSQIVGKIKLALAPPLNHWWHVALHLSATGLTTRPVPFSGGLLDVSFDFVRHELRIETSEGAIIRRPLAAEPVSAFYAGVMNGLASVGAAVEINCKPQEVADPVPFDVDHAPRSYDPEAAHRFWRILVSTARVLERFRGQYYGKSSPAHFFWGSFDLACTRFSGRSAPPRKGVISGPAYSHEVSSAGFWPGGGAIDGPAFYAYTIPQPAGLESARVRPATASWNGELSEFILMYDDVRTSAEPEEALYEFLSSTYEAGATLGNWDRSALEVKP